VRKEGGGGKRRVDGISHCFVVSCIVVVGGVNSTGG